ncbi:TRAM domain-containing protein [Microbacterium sp. X-17]|uniref:class I SAM-dependent RNA methyltransferase n=1 Tax=Microbacterium sp. X-17 TaxID=3144404 RepID=UPI0031F5013E
METGDEIELDVTDIAHGGVFVARHEGRVVFVSDTLPGERVRARLTDVGKASFWRADTVEVLDPSPHRRPHVWASADVGTAPEDRPGGAEFGHIARPHQLALKERVLADALRRFARIEPAVSVEEARPLVAGAAAAGAETADGTGWRTRVSLHVDAAGRIGPYAARSHRVIPVEDLPLATPAVARAARALAARAEGRIDLVQPADGRVRILPRPEGRARPDARERELLIERVGDREFRVDAGGFWQVHRLAAATLWQTVSRRLAELPDLDPEAWHLDLYGGVGLFAALLGQHGGPRTRVTSVESDAAATERAGENLAEWVGARAETGRVDRWLAQLDRTASAAERARLGRGVVVLDPPRAGAGRPVVEALGRLHPSAIVYVACDPVALARDLATFRAAGYAPRSIDGLDLFPNSHHVEAIAVILPGAADEPDPVPEGLPPITSST